MVISSGKKENGSSGGKMVKSQDGLLNKPNRHTHTQAHEMMRDKVSPNPTCVRGQLPTIKWIIL